MRLSATGQCRNVGLISTDLLHELRRCIPLAFNHAGRLRIGGGHAGSGALHNPVRALKAGDRPRRRALPSESAMTDPAPEFGRGHFPLIRVGKPP